MAQKTLRLLKTGGCSYCSSPEHLVGKGRCNHIPGLCFKQKQEKGMIFVEISSLDGSSEGLPNAKVDTEKLDTYVQDLDKALSNEKKNKIIDFFSSHNKD